MPHSTTIVVRYAPVGEDATGAPDEPYLDLYLQALPDGDRLTSVVLRRGNPEAPLSRAPEGVRLLREELEPLAEALVKSLDHR